MTHELPDLQEAFAKAFRMPWAYIASYSWVFLGPTPSKVSWKNVTNARFFGQEGELRFFRQDDGLAAVWIDDQPQAGQLEIIVDKTLPLIPKFGSTVTMRQHIYFDEDGQACIYTTRLTAWKGVEYNDAAGVAAKSAKRDPGAL